MDGKYAWTIDAKGPDEEIKAGANVEQTYFYAIHPDVRVGKYALCNGHEFIVFDTYSGAQLLYFHLSEIEHHWKALEGLLGPAAFQGKKEITAEPVKPSGDFDYQSLKPLEEIKNIKKQSAKRHFGVHGYFTKQPFIVVQEYIKNFTKPGDIVLDPYGGSGVTVIEALMLGRKGIHIDLNPLSVFIVKNLIEPVDIGELADTFKDIKAEFDKQRPTTRAQITAALKKYPYPKDIPLMKNADVDSIEKLFTPAQLAQLGYLKYLIKQVSDKSIRNSLLLAFSSTLTKINRTYHPSTTRGDNAGDSAAFRYYRFRVAVEEVALDVMNSFTTKVKKLINAKREVASLINEKTIGNVEVYKGTATNLDRISDQSIDYIYTDPPYGAKIPYLDLSIMWTAWLDLPIQKKDYELEAIEGGEQNKTKEQYSNLISQSINEMYRVLKFDRWMSFVFAHKDPAYWHMIVEAAEAAGFEYAGAIQQSSGQATFKKRQNPFTVLRGQLIINFKKVENPKSIMKVDLGADITDIIIQTIEGVIAKDHGATIDEINDELILRGLELGFLDILSKKYQDLTPFLVANFDYDSAAEKYHLRKNTKFKAHIDVRVRLRYYLISYLRRMAHQKRNPTFDEIVLNIMPLLKNGETPKSQTILNELEKLAVHVGEDRWRLVETGQQGLFEGP
ncbi:MAG TPA: DNA methyltransferase [Pyrinomonadaceae bacterium]|nr:DNA methyltransferase [Pyrinomonadaceae bacterium]